MQFVYDSVKFDDNVPGTSRASSIRPTHGAWYNESSGTSTLGAPSGESTQESAFSKRSHYDTVTSSQLDDLQHDVEELKHLQQLILHMWFTLQKQ